MIRPFNIRFNRLEPDSPYKWVVEDAITHESFEAESVNILVTSSTHTDPMRTLYSIRATGILVWQGKNAIIK